MFTRTSKSYLTSFITIKGNVCVTSLARKIPRSEQCLSECSKIPTCSSLFSTCSGQSRDSLATPAEPKLTSKLLSYHMWKWRPRMHIRGFAEDIPKKYSIYSERDIDIEREEMVRASADLGKEAGTRYLTRKSQYTAGNMAPVSEAVILKLEDTFGLTREEALRVVRSPKFFLVADAAILETISCLGDFGIPAERIKRSPWLLLQAVDDLTEKINMTAEEYLFHNYFEGLGFCYFGKYKIRMFQKFFLSESEEFPEHYNRVYYMADKLMVPVDHLTDEIVKVQRVLTMNFHRIDAYIKILNKYGIRREDILSDMWIFFNNIDMAERRLQRIIDAGCTRPKLWMCRCPEEVFETTANRYQAKKDALGECRSLEEYLMKRLNCTAEELSSQLDYNESLKTVNIAKIQRIIDLLYSEGFTSYQILHSLRILKYSEKRTAMRIKRIKGMGITSIPVSVLYKSPISFEIYCDNLTERGYRKT